MSEGYSYKAEILDSEYDYEAGRVEYRIRLTDNSGEYAFRPNIERTLRYTFGIAENEISPVYLISAVDETPPPEFSLKNGEIPLDCDYLLLGCGKDFPYTENIFEFEDRILLFYTDKTVSAVSTETGEQLYSFSTEEYYSDSCEVPKYKTDEKEGFDYRMDFRDESVYFSSKDPSAMYAEPLPEEIETADIWLDSERLYSKYGSRYVYTSEEGIMLFDAETGEEELILANSNVEAEVKPIAVSTDRYTPETEAPYRYFEPAFICGGTKVVSKVTSQGYVYFAFVIYDLAEEKIESAYSYLEQFVPNYPIEDRYVTLATNEGYRVTDSKTGESAVYQDSIKSGTHKTFFTEKYSSEDGSDYNEYWFGLKCYMNTPEDENKLLFSVTDDATGTYVCGATEHYVFVLMLNWDYEEKALCAVRYTD